jgi:oligosaccharide repeat unit polymerase
MKNNFITKPLFLFNLMYLFLIIFTQFGFFNLNKPSILSIIYVFIGVIFINLGFFLSYRKKVNYTVYSLFLCRNYNLKTSVFLNAFLFLSFLLLLPDVIISFDLFINYGYSLGHIRTLFVQNDPIFFSYRNLYINSLRYLLLNPAFFLAPIVLSYNLFKKFQINFSTLISACIIIFFIITQGGRTILVHLIFYFTLLFFYKILSKKSDKSLKIYLMIGAALVLFFFLTTLSRGQSDIIKSIYIYFFGSLPHFDYRLETFDSNFVHTLGLTSIFGFFRTLVLFSKNIFNFIPEIFELTQIQIISLESPVDIGNIGFLYNAFVTPFLYFYIDFGIYGIVLLSFLYGLLYKFTYVKAFFSNSRVFKFHFMLLTLSLIFSFVRFEFSNPGFALAYFYIIIIFK